MSANKRKATRKPVASKRWTGRRWHLVLAFWLVCAGVLVVRAVDLQVVEHDFLAHQGDIRNLRVEPLAANRGVIRDRNGRPLAVSTPVVTLWANPQEAMENQQQWSKLTGNPIIDRARFARRVKAHASREFKKKSQ
eukprot:gnl/TRDRNA2_/TRDRNA2_175318_c0_seq6.p1 gnl/TRDRNA2_/TRDRNA2_175318_c0~~gnl/TRDRNA2_/TRDRNA2_175318_c0_seq6.p1  ORF type:complete len:136 (-),score=6.88 gnl/TRDRNA2_/TRDRNA2_175318_c0_seq6:64-471(-)